MYLVCSINMRSLASGSEACKRQLCLTSVSASSNDTDFEAPESSRSFVLMILSVRSDSPLTSTPNMRARMSERRKIASKQPAQDIALIQGWASTAASYWERSAKKFWIAFLEIDVNLGAWIGANRWAEAVNSAWLESGYTAQVSLNYYVSRLHKGKKPKVLDKVHKEGELPCQAAEGAWPWRLVVRKRFLLSVYSRIKIWRTLIYMNNAQIGGFPNYKQLLIDNRYDNLNDVRINVDKF